jgi:signal transduction histidine kinase
MVDVGSVSREVCEEGESSRHGYEFDLQPNLIVTCDVIRVSQLVSNLIANATKYSPSGGKIRVAAWFENGIGHLTVTDEGVGIPATDLAHIFDRFHRGDNVDDRRFAGMGLGLFICRKIALQHGGQIDVTSDGDGCGATFHLQLPISENEHQPVEQKPSTVSELTPARVET